MHLGPENQSKQRQNDGQTRAKRAKKKADRQHQIADTFYNLPTAANAYSTIVEGFKMMALDKL
jgi:hypothetical protein